MSDGNTIYSAPGRPPATAGVEATTIGLAAAAGTAVAAIAMVQLAPDAQALAPDLLELAKQQQLAISALANIATTTVVATLVSMFRNWRFSRSGS